MIKFGKAVVKLRIPILILAVILLIPSVLGMLNTRINYDMLDYLPEDMDTVKGQNILLEDFGKGAFSLVMVEGMQPRDVSALKAQMEGVPHVETVLWYDSLSDISIPMELLPQKVYDAFNNGDTTLMAVFFDTSTSADETMQAIASIRALAGKQCFVSGMSAMVTDLKDLCEREEPIYVGLAVLLACAAMMLFMDNYLIPFIFLGSIGMAILLNLGTNYFMGEISYITKALSAVLQLAVTMDYSIFLWHSYGEQQARFPGDKKRAMAHAVAATITSVVGSSITTVAGFIALCFMSFTLGFDLGVVMAKGVILGVIGCVTTLPAMILLFDKALQKAQHRPLLPKMDKAARLVTRRSWVFLIVFVALLVPAFYGYMNTATYYDLGEALPKDMAYVIANTKLREEFDMASTHMILADAELPPKQAREMLEEIGQVDGVKFALGFDSVLGSTVPEEVVPDTLKAVLKGDRYQLILVSSQYKVASDAVNSQIDQIGAVLKKYDPSGMLIGEAPCTKDMIEVTDHDFQVVNAISIIAIFVIIALVLKSITLPVILVAVIELAIFINLGIPYYTGVSLPFVAPICISTIQLGATVDYAILMTTRYKRERGMGKTGREAVDIALSASIPSILVSALGFFAATFGVALYSNVDIISSMCSLMARGAIVSMLCVLFILPAMLILFDKVIVRTSLGFRNKNA
ncbi:MMPL family transporter [Christensenellaceae bacterium NSJ-44]|uniref:MMPL family transporter n=1 Tax=Luoshenia tenuis TaxID=2763654 RepID=A0A926HNQ6_9FIRM|nr:MMPL family transporter [Luoshenia tenuis]MBC8529910.1 MMPL family transporter [Luoshenia tenuis]